MRLADFVDHPDARVAALSDAHVLALRLYTTLVYKSINTPLRKLAHTPAAGSASARPHPLPVTVAFLSEAIKKLRAVAGASQGDTTASGRDRTSHGDTSNVHESKQGGVDATPALGVDDCTTPALTAANETAGGRGNGGTGAPGPLGSVRSSPHRLLDLWRGLKDVSISGNEAFFRRGGTEVAPMSTTTSLEVALRYGASETPVLMQLKAGSFMNMGVDVGFLSAFADECERLYPPLTFLEPKGKPRHVDVKLANGKHVTYTVIVATPHFGS